MSHITALSEYGLGITVQIRSSSYASLPSKQLRYDKKITFNAYPLEPCYSWLFPQQLHILSWC